MDSEHDDSENDARETPVASAGAQLRAAREALQRDLAHVAAETRIPLRHLEAIESGNFEALPSRAYAIGFSRTYAKAVGLDAVAITDTVRGELADGKMGRTQPTSGMEPGDPARLPSAGLAWAAALAALVLAVGAYAFYNSQFGAGTEPGPLLAPAPVTTPVPVAVPGPATTPAANSGAVVLTAVADGVWLRLYEEGGERLIERTLKLGETVAVPATARDPRINTGRPDALTITIDGKPVAKLSERSMTLSGVPVSAAALLARAAPASVASDEPATPPTAVIARPARRESAPAAATRSDAPAGGGAPETAPVSADGAATTSDGADRADDNPA